MGRIRFAVRSLAKAPLLSLVVIVSLGLGIGANTAIFSLLDQIILRTLPVQHPEQLVLITAPGEFKSGRQSTSTAGGMDYIFSYKALRQLESHPAGVTGVAGFKGIGANLAFGNQTLSDEALLVSGGYFEILGVQPLAGRMLEPADDTGGGNPVAVLGYGFWHDRLGGAEVLNRPLRINGQVFTVVGVAPRRFTGTTLGDEPAVFVPMVFQPKLVPGWDGTGRYDDYWVYLLARLKPGVTLAQAQAALNGPYSAFVQEQAKTVHREPAYMTRFLKARLTLRPGRQGGSDMRDEARTPLLILITATALVLLIAIANAANLLLGRSAHRRKELAIRAAMGAGRGELMGQLLTEALLLSFCGGVAGLGFGLATIKLLLAEMSHGQPPGYALTAQLDGTLLLFGFGLTLATGLLFGLYPAWDAARSSLASTLKDESGQSSSTRGSARVRRSLVCVQVMISAILLIPTGLFLKSLVNILRVDLGMNTENVLTFGLSPELNGYNWEQCRAILQRAETELAAVPGVRSVATALVPLLGGSNWGHSLTVESYPNDIHADTFSNMNQVGPGFFGKMGIPLIAGREFTPADNLAGARVAIVNQQFAKHFFGNGNPIGRKYTEGLGPKIVPDREIVGVVKDTRYSGVKQKPPRLDYTPWRQDKQPGSLNYYVRTALPAGAIVPQIRRVMSGIDRNLPVENLRTLDDQIAMNIESDRLVVELAAAFGILATLLAMLGLYGVMAQSVVRRTREIGIRMALGAGPGRILSMVMREMAWILGIGLVVGVPAALALSRLTESQLYGVKSFDALVLAAALGALVIASAAAGYLPARRAARIDPLDALRYE